MASCDPFTVAVSGDPQTVLDQVRSKIISAGGSFAGDAQAGTFSGSSPLGAVKGKYVVSGQDVTVTITDKPFLVPCSRIESEIRGYFGR